MESRTHYFKRHHADQARHYYKLLDGRQPPAREILNFLGRVPVIDLSSFDLDSPSGKIQGNTYLQGAV